MTKGEKAFLEMIAYAEGTLGISNNGYDVLVNPTPHKGARVIKGWTEDTKITHGQQKWAVKIGNVTSTAAGRYQITGPTWLELNNKDNVAINKKNQDAAAIKYARRKLGDTYNFIIQSESEFSKALTKLNKVWDSFNHKSHKELYEIYVKAYAKY